MWLVLIPPPLSKVGDPKTRVGCRKVSPHGSCPVPGCRMPHLSCAMGSLGAVGWHSLCLQLPGRTPSPAPGWQEQVKMWMCFFVTSERT